MLIPTLATNTLLLQIQVTRLLFAFPYVLNFTAFSASVVTRNGAFISHASDLTQTFLFILG
jgi:hypothetical protein